MHTHNHTHGFHTGYMLFIYKEPLYKEYMWTAKIFKELILLMEKNPRILSIPKIFITANNQELGSLFRSFTVATYIDTFMKLLFYLISSLTFEF